MDSSDIYINKKEELELKGEEKPIDYTIPATAVGKLEEITFSETEQVITGRDVGRSISSPIDLGEESIISDGDNKIDFQQYRLTNIKEPVEDSDAVTKNYVDTHSSQSLTAGANISIVDNVISATDTTYSDFTGTDGADPGTSGLVPAPATTDAGKYLKADGTWDTVSAGPTVVQTTGTSQTDVMSQVAASQMIYPSGYETSKTMVRIGNGASPQGNFAICISTSSSQARDYAVAIGNGAYAHGNNSVAIGRATLAGLADANSIAIGFGSTTSRSNEFSIGGGTGYAPATRYIANVTDPQLAQDAATKNYVDSFYPVGTVYTSTSSTAPTFAGGTWTQLGSQTIGSSTVYYYERTV